MWLRSSSSFKTLELYEAYKNVKLINSDLIVLMLDLFMLDNSKFIFVQHMPQIIKKGVETLLKIRETSCQDNLSKMYDPKNGNGVE